MVAASAEACTNFCKIAALMKLNAGGGRQNAGSLLISMFIGKSLWPTQHKPADSARQAERHHASTMRHNLQQYAHMKRDFLIVKAVAAGEKESAVEAFKLAVPVNRSHRQSWV